MVDVDPKLIRSFIRGVVFWPFVLAAILCVMVCRFDVYKRFRLIFSWRGAVGVCVVWGLAFSHQFGVAAHFRQPGQEDFFSKNYINPKSVSVDLSNGRSLLLVYVESLERAYSDKSIFGKDLLAPLSVERRNGLAFEQFEQMPGASWTIASVVSSQCGIPLKSVMVFGGNKQGQNLASYLPGAMCLGDVLKQNGYKNVFMNGADLSFSGMGVFMATHGYDEMYGRQEWLKKGYPREQMNGWGLYDGDLFNESRIALDRLMAEREPFNLTVLTIDAHGPEGFLSESCQKRGFVGGFESVLECSVHDLASLLDYVEAKG
ncbi:sulfatase-like hydrolase/transferase [Crenobacter caeni]|uniref:Sulfatase-like hydrolase/transferase n=1 Tax=Crenobacter caeni TaxID=2705474 RepID=A0A6B2KTX1_9NEIS|nr:sulfatase-like hydrolase/transferase [Crenobacter caeni]NDV13473.1 sulfatase-like hydrolase/transferase [Crenobacter caeni]